MFNFNGLARLATDKLPNFKNDVAIPRARGTPVVTATFNQQSLVVKRRAIFEVPF